LQQKRQKRIVFFGALLTAWARAARNFLFAHCGVTLLLYRGAEITGAEKSAKMSSARFFLQKMW
jgi:hypothetical protein